MIITDIARYLLPAFFPTSLVLSADSSPLNLVPLPLRHFTGDGSTPLCLSSTFTISLDTASLDGHEPPDDLLRGLKRTEQNLAKIGMTYLSPDHGAKFLYAGKCDRYLDSLIVHLTNYDGSTIFDQSVSPVETRPDHEAYNLSIPLHGAAKITTGGALGAFRGLTTFEGLWYTLEPSSRRGKGEKVAYAPHAPYEIEDKPAFGWRAVLLDTSRNYFSIQSILKILDTMSLVKLNVFHWHVTDSNSWPLVLKGFPELASEGAYSPEEVYTEEDVKEIVKYAGERGIDVLLEIDTPGHTAAIALSHPDHIACFESTPYKQFAHQPPAGQLRFADQATTTFTEAVLADVAGLAKSRYMSTGGDEINMNCMSEDGPTTAALAANGWTLDDALDVFTNETHAALRDKGITPVVWQEMVLDHGAMPSLTNDTIVDIWVNSKDARRVLDQGYRIVHASADYFYLDCGQSGWITEEGGGPGWCDPLKTWARMYSFDPFKDVRDEERHLILGGQTSLWAEQTDENNLEPTMWPRAAAAAEVFWSGPGSDGKPRSAAKAIARMHDIRYRMVDRGVRASPLQPHWCALRPEACTMGA
ncbi:hypothetical protein IAR55_007053 [Kwoniella newhampshirensis]|uniref:beta-N-acetylhexosaminidase n=1 Tax=Kwoniella newhampshirensis TaxID=1651941 RepID=A0AAW0YDX7_9TREE